MKRSHVVIAAAAIALVCLCRTGSAQFVTYYSPVVTPTETVVMSPVVQPSETVVYRPVTPTVAARPVQRTVLLPTAQTVTVARPVVTTTAWAPVTYTTTRRRPILGGTVTRVRRGFAPVTVAQPAW